MRCCKKELFIPCDQYSNPSYAGNIASHILKLIRMNFSGIIHVSDSDYMSKYEFALSTAKFHDLDYKLIKPIKTSETKQAAQRPLKSGFKS